jgi:hypothetical protein
MPVYFQAIDTNGHAVQSMRSWSTLMPGENASCVGCHEDKSRAPLPAAVTAAMKAGPQDLKPFHGKSRGFSYPKEIQPIWDKHCIKCHTGGKGDDGKVKPFSLLAKDVVDRGAKRRWSESYLALTKRGPNKIVNWLNVQSIPPMLPPYYKGAAKSKLTSMLKVGHKKTKLTQAEHEKIACWIDLLVPFGGDYVEANAWSDKEQAFYQRFADKRKRMEEIEMRNIQALIAHRATAR